MKHIKEITSNLKNLQETWELTNYIVYREAEKSLCTVTLDKLLCRPPAGRVDLGAEECQCRFLNPHWKIMNWRLRFVGSWRILWRKDAGQALAIISCIMSLTAGSSDRTISFIATCFWASMPTARRTNTWTPPKNFPDSKHVCERALGGTTSVACKFKQPSENINRKEPTWKATEYQTTRPTTSSSHLNTSFPNLTCTAP